MLFDMSDEQAESYRIGYENETKRIKQKYPELVQIAEELGLSSGQDHITREDYYNEFDIKKVVGYLLKNNLSLPAEGNEFKKEYIKADIHDLRARAQGLEEMDPPISKKLYEEADQLEKEEVL